MKSITVHRQAQKRVLVVLLVLLTAVCAVSCIGLSIVSGLAPVRKLVWNVFTMWGCGHCSQELVDSDLPVDLAWRFDSYYPLGGAPAVGNSGVALVKAGSEIHALDSKHGQIRWKKKAGSLDEYGVILPYENSVLLTTQNDSVIWSMDTRDGSLIWQTDLREFVQASAPSLKPEVVHAVYDGVRLYLVVALSRGTQVLALDPASGKLMWLGAPELSTLIGNPDAVSVSNDGLTMISNQNMIILDAETGSFLSQTPLILDSFRPPVLNHGTIYTNGKQARAIDATTLQEKWRFETPCFLPGNQVYPRLLSDKVVYVAPTCGGLYAIDAVDGHVLWQFSPPSQSSVDAFAVFHGLGYAQTNDAKVYAIDLSTGSVVGKAEFSPSKTPAADKEALVANDDLLLLHFGSRSLFAFR